MLAAALLLLLLATAILFLLKIFGAGSRSGEPFGVFRLDEAVQILDEEGRVLRTLPFPHEVGGAGSRIPPAQIDRADLDGDGVRDLVFLTIGKDSVSHAKLHLLYGASLTLREEVPLWRDPPREAAGVTSRFHPVFVRVLHGGAGRPTSILVGAGNDSSLGYLLHLDLELRERGIYWTWGFPSWSQRETAETLAEIDLTGDGRNEVLVAVRDDEHGGPALVAFAEGDIRGFAPHPPGVDHFPSEAAAGSHLVWILFPQSDVTPPAYKTYVHDLVVLQDEGLIRVAINEGSDHPKFGVLNYLLDMSLRVVEVRTEDSFVKAHMHCRADGDVSSVLDAAYLEALRARVRYHDGSSWSSEPPPLRER